VPPGNQGDGDIVRQAMARYLAAAWLPSPEERTTVLSGTIYALLYLVNNTSNLISIPFSGASTPDAWGTYGDTQQRFPGYVCMPDGTPPRMLASGQVMVFGTKSDGGFGAMTGAGGKLSISLPGSQTAWMTWSVPWSYYNGLDGSANGDQGVIEPGIPSSQPFTIDGGAVGCTAPGEAPQQECDFVFTLAGGPPAGSTSPPNTPAVDRYGHGSRACRW
jgi:hypothetical protein